MTSTLIDVVTDKLLERFDDAVEIPVRDGPDNISTSTESAVYVGVRLDESADEFVGDVNLSQEYRQAVGRKAMDEFGEIPCSILTYSGDATTRARRAKAIAAFHLCKASILADVGLDDQVVDSTVGQDFRLVYMTTNAGNVVVLTFTVTYHAILYP